MAGMSLKDAQERHERHSMLGYPTDFWRCPASPCAVFNGINKGRRRKP